jgi:hypothetical protein
MTSIFRGLAFLTPLTLLFLSVSSAEDAPNMAQASPYSAPNPGAGLKFTQGGKGLTSLKYDGEELLYKHFGSVDLFKRPSFTKTEGPVDSINEKATALSEGNAVTQTFSWGRIRTVYLGDFSRLTMALTVENTSGEDLQSLELQLAVLKFPEIPTGAVIDVGMWGNGGVSKLGSYPMKAGGKNSPPVLALQSPVALMHFCQDTNDDDAHVGIPFSVDGAVSRAFPFVAYIGAIPAGSKRELKYSLRFSVNGPITFAAAREVLDNFARRYPLTFKWDDRRPIGMMFLATSGVQGQQQKVNPRRWMVVVDGGRFDITTPEGKIQFRQGLLKWADNSIKIHLEAGAQGMVTWDIEGQEFPSATFYGEPHLIGELAPEMEEEVEVTFIENGQPKMMKMLLVDAYFRKFRDAGLRTGVCLRPQDLKFRPNGDPYQAVTSGEEAYQDMKEDLEYAKKRWGCTLFYIDSTVDYKAKGSLDPELFMRLQQEHPDVLLMPENQTLRYYTCSAPLDSMVHHAVTRTAPRIRDLWPEAFTVTMANGGTTVLGDASNTPEVRAERREQMLNGVKQGDILMFSGWYMNPGIEEIKSIYNDARNSGLERTSQTP